MLKIGEFSRLSQVTIKTLHHYDDIGLLQPAHVDQFTHHRYYTVDQLPIIHRIVALKELGLSLEQIIQMVHDELNAHELRGMLRLKQGELQQRLREEQARLSQVEFRLRMIEMEDKMPELEVIIKKVPPMRALTLRTSIKTDDLVALGRAFEQALAQHDIKMVGPATEIHYDEDFKMDFKDVEFVLPVDETQTDDVPLESFGTLTLKTIAGIEKAATHIHRGTDATDAMILLQRWVVDNGYELRGSHRAVHHRGPFEHAEYEDWIIEFQHPLENA